MILEYNGSTDLGGGMKSLYNVKLLQNGGGGAPFNVDQYFLGISAPFGTVWAGKVAGVTDANVPGGSLDSVAGSGDVGLTGSRDGQLRYESPRINGLKLGISGVLNGSKASTDAGNDNPAGSLDEMNIMAHYELPIGLVMALGYETKDRVAGNAEYGPGAASDHHEVSDKSSGFRFGATYSQDNWTVAYNYRKYNEHQGFAGPGKRVYNQNTVGNFDSSDDDISEGFYSFIAQDDNTANNAANQMANQLDIRNSSTEYQGHRMAAQFVVDRVTMSANYSTETVSTDVPAGIPGNVEGGSKDVVSQIEVSRTTLGVDAKYALGAKSWIALGHQNQDTESYTDEDGKNVHIKPGTSPRSTKVGTTTLRYGVSF